jgi:prevent-host-death family protein
MTTRKKQSTEESTSRGASLYRVSASDARNQFPSVAQMAVREGPVVVEKRGEPEVVVMSWADYLKMGQEGVPDLMDELRNQFEARAAEASSSDASERFKRALFSGDLSVMLPGEPGDGKGQG